MMQESQTFQITTELIENAQTYSEYREMIDQLLAENKTTGTNHDAGYLDYTKMNIQRMNRWDKTAKISSELEKAIVSVIQPQIWLVITEGWCGDAAQNLPFIAKVAALNPLIELKFVLRDENPDLMEGYLTYGAKSIPILIALTKDLSKELFVWGPRPEFLQNRMKAYKIDPQNITQHEYVDGTHLWYARDKNISIAEELTKLISTTL
jgi:hypothetical protein